MTRRTGGGGCDRGSPGHPEHPAWSRPARPEPERDHERAALVDQSRVPTPRLPGRCRGCRARPTSTGTPCPDSSRKPSKSPGGWLTTVASRICLDLLRSARARRERYLGEWIPESARTVSGQPGLVAQQDGVTVTVMAFDVVGDRIKYIGQYATREARPWTTV